MRGATITIGCLLLAVTTSTFAADDGICTTARAHDPTPTVAAVYLKSMSILSVREQKILFASLSHDLKVDLWKHKLATFGTQKRITPEQRALLDEGVALLDPALYSDTGPPAALVARLVRFKEKAIQLFGHDRAAALFANLGTGAEDEVSAQLAECQCSVEDDWCGNPRYDVCVQWRCACAETRWGCGTFWGFPCNGMCCFVVMPCAPC